MRIRRRFTLFRILQRSPHLNHAKFWSFICLLMRGIAIFLALSGWALRRQMRNWFCSHDVRRWISSGEFHCTHGASVRMSCLTRSVNEESSSKYAQRKRTVERSCFTATKNCASLAFGSKADAKSALVPELDPWNSVQINAELSVVLLDGETNTAVLGYCRSEKQTNHFQWDRHMEQSISSTLRRLNCRCK